MAQKRNRTSKASTSSAPLTQDSSLFPNYLFFLQANAEKHLKVKYYKVVSERALDVQDLEGYEELVIMLEDRG